VGDPLIGGGTVILVEGASFAISDAGGDVVPGGSQGLFLRDTRFLSRYECWVNGARPEGLAISQQDPFSAIFVARARSHAEGPAATLLVTRSRYVGRGMREDLRIRNVGAEPAYCLVELFVDSDFATTSEVREGRTPRTEQLSRSKPTPAESAQTQVLLLGHRRGGTRRGCKVELSVPFRLAGNLISLEAIVPAGGDWSVCVQVTPVIDDVSITPRYTCGQPVDRAMPSERLARWRREVPLVETDHPALRQAVARSSEDLGLLRLFDPDHPSRAVVAAGAPWAMSLVGRDSILTSWMALLADPDLALGVLETLARFQGSRIDPLTEEEPGRILHQMRFGEGPGLTPCDGQVSYASTDATPLFVMLLGELRRWGLAREVVDRLMPHADAALDWVQGFGDRDGDGYVECQRSSDRSPANQGWKSSADGIRYSDGRVAKGPIALCEVQAYVYGAYLARTHFAREAGDEATATRCATRAAELKAAFNRDFWLPEQGWFAVGLDADKVPIDSLTSNIGHCLWTGIVDESHATPVAAHLASPVMSSGWGVRTLASNMGGYNPLSYHCGSVWPHDSAIVAAGLMRYGFVAEAQSLVMALLDAAQGQGGRLPELYSGIPRVELPTLISYPTSCSPQATAAAAPLLALRTLLRLDPWVPYGKVWLAPALPESISYLRVDRIPLGGGRVTVEVSHGETKVEGLPPGLELVREPRVPITAV
jgi:glycogen debranching enzyme